MKKRVLMRTLMGTAVIGVFATTAWSQGGQGGRFGVLATVVTRPRRADDTGEAAPDREVDATSDLPPAGRGGGGP